MRISDWSSDVCSSDLIIISGGLNISAAEVERVVAGFDGVFEVAVIGAADAKFGETPLAIIHSTLPLQIEQIVAHCNQNIAAYKVPRYIVVEAAPLPRPPTGQPAKLAMRSRFAEPTGNASLRERWCMGG